MHIFQLPKLHGDFHQIGPQTPELDSLGIEHCDRAQKEIVAIARKHFVKLIGHLLTILEDALATP